MPIETTSFADKAALSFERLSPIIMSSLSGSADNQLFLNRLSEHFNQFFEAYLALYADQYDFFYHLQQVMIILTSTFAQRTEPLRQLDRKRELNPSWFQSEQMLGGVCYVDLFAGDLGGIREKVPYFRELGLTYLHLMPVYKSPVPHNDGGYAVSSFRQIAPKLGTMDQLRTLSEALRAEGISLVLDFVFNHTSDEHEWAVRALQGEKRYQQFYWLFEDRVLPDEYEKNLREIFPDQAPGSFTFRPDLQKWVWTTFYPFQWDLNYANPEVFTAMLREMLFLANQGVEVLRLDAVPFVWKRLGTNCENLPEVHLLIQAYNALMRIAAPALLFKSEAIVHPNDVRSYISPDKCQLSYNPILMVSLWEAVATRDVRFMTHTMQKQFPLVGNVSWVNYLRSHDDIGWGFADEDALEMGINAFDHRYFLSMFFTGRFPGSFAAGIPFNYNPRTQDMRISGTLASLAGLEQAVKLGDEILITYAIKRILLMFSIIMSAGGIPLIYLGDEIGTLNDYSYSDDPQKTDDSRWVHRPFAKAEAYSKRDVQGELTASIYNPLRQLIEIRRKNSLFANGTTVFFSSGNPHIFAYKHNDGLLCLANFSDFDETVELEDISDHWQIPQDAFDLVSNEPISAEGQISLSPYQIMWVVEKPS